MSERYGGDEGPRREAEGRGGASDPWLDEGRYEEVQMRERHVSGAHVNPAVTLGLAATNKFPWQYVPIYLGTQIVGAALGAIATWIAYGSAAREAANLAATTPAEGVGDLQALLVEILVTFIL